MVSTYFHDFIRDDGTRVTIEYDKQAGEVVAVWSEVRLTDVELERLERWLADKLYFDRLAGEFRS